MARVEDLVSQVGDAALRRELAGEVALLKKRQKFGLVFEGHIPETTLLHHAPIGVGSLVARRDDRRAQLLRVVARDGENLRVEPVESKGTARNLTTADVLVYKRFGEPIFPTLRSLGTIERGGDKPFHAVLNAENYHALELLTFTHAGQVDMLYLDPPFNTGARDWKYNNHYVDSNDAWRHSKWLSMMEKRLRLAKRLLKPDGVLVVMIDEHEVHHLGLLLEQMFGEAYRQMVTIVINPKGVTQGRFSRVEEYALFCFLGNSTVAGLGDDLLTPETDDEDTSEGARPRWKGLLRSGTNARRQDRRNLFFPVLIDPERGAVLGAGDPLPLDEEPDFETKINGLTPVWPVRRNGSLGNWGVGHVTLRSLINKGYVALGGYDERRNTWGLSYLSRRSQNQVASGMLVVESFDETRNVVDVKYTAVNQRQIKTVWHRSSHDAGVGGTDVLGSLLGDARAFPFPKSVYAVRDTLAAVLRNRPDALIVDFFAGSGTTLHATALLNAETGGRRRCILVTNNEVDDKTARALARRHVYPGDAEYERHGIFEQATKPRVEAVVTGLRPDGQPATGEHLGGRPFSEGFHENVEFFQLEYLDQYAVELGLRFDELYPVLWFAAGASGARGEPPGDKPGHFVAPHSPFAVLTRAASVQALLADLENRQDVTHVFVVADSDTGYAEIASAMPPMVQTRRLYEDYLRAFRAEASS